MSNQQPMLHDVLLVGHYCHDTLIAKDGTERTELGGAAAYASAVLLGAGMDFRVAAKVGEDFRYPGAVAKPPQVVQGAATTTFIDDYRGAERVGTLVARAPPIDPGDLGEVRCRAGMACAIAGEIGAETLARLRELSGLLIGDAQGFVRKADTGGRIVHHPPDAALRAQIDRLDWLKLSRSEAAVLGARKVRCRTIVTAGDQGCILNDGGHETHVPAFAAVEVDPTGAGDCFLAGFAVGLLRGWEPARAARFASYCGALAVSQHGVPRLTSADLDAFSDRASIRGPSRR